MESALTDDVERQSTGFFISRNRIQGTSESFFSTWREGFIGILAIATDAALYNSVQQFV